MLYFNVVHEQDDILICWLVGSPGLAFHVGVHQHEGKGVKASLSEVRIFLLRHHESHQLPLHHMWHLSDSRHCLDLPAVGGSTERSFMTVTRQSRERQNTSVKVLVCSLIILITSLLWNIENIEKNVGTKFKWNGILLSIHIIII